MIGRGTGVYGVDAAGTTEMLVHHGDLAFHATPRKRNVFIVQCWIFPPSSFKSFVWILRFLLKLVNNISSLKVQ